MPSGGVSNNVRLYEGHIHIHHRWLCKAVFDRYRYALHIPKLQAFAKATAVMFTIAGVQKPRHGAPVLYGYVSEVKRSWSQLLEMWLDKT